MLPQPGRPEPVGARARDEAGGNPADGAGVGERGRDSAVEVRVAGQRARNKSWNPAVRRRLRRPVAARANRSRDARRGAEVRSEEHTSELQSLMRISYAVFC